MAKRIRSDQYTEIQLKKEVKCRDCKYTVIKGSIARKRGRIHLCTPCWIKVREAEKVEK